MIEKKIKISLSVLFLLVLAGCVTNSLMKQKERSEDVRKEGRKLCREHHGGVKSDQVDFYYKHVRVKCNDGSEVEWWLHP